MRDGNRVEVVGKGRCRQVVSLPMRDGNSSTPPSITNRPGVVSLPMRDGNTSGMFHPMTKILLLAYL